MAQISLRSSRSRRRRATAIAAWVGSASALMALGAPASAQTDAPTPPAGEAGAASAERVLGTDRPVLQTITVTGRRSAQADAVYSAPRSSAYIGTEEIERYGQTSPADLLTGQPGVQTGDSRNGGALDVNIRGVQGQSRVPVMVDGAQQSLNTYRGYSGTQQRSYIDTDFIGGVFIHKGPSLDANAAGAVGGSVQISTIGIDDVVLPGQRAGVRLKLDLADNSLQPPLPESKPVPRTASSTRWNHLAKAGSIAVGFRGERIDGVAAYARRFQGNYQAGTQGREKYRTFNRFGTEGLTVGRMYHEGEEVMNSSRETESALLKATLKLTPEQRLALAYRYFDGRYAEIMPSVILRGLGTRDPNTSRDALPQWPLGSVRMDSYTARYTYAPADNDWIHLSANAWATVAKTEMLNGSAEYSPASQHYLPPGMRFADYAWRRQHSQRYGFDLSNRSDIGTGFGKFVLNLGASYQNERLKPADGVELTTRDVLNNRVVADGAREEMSLNAELEYQPTRALSLRAGGRFIDYRTSDFNRYSQRTAWGGNLPGGPAFDPPLKRRDNGFAPALGATFKFSDSSFVYANYTEGLRMPSLFESTLGTDALLPADGLAPERARNFELGASTLQSGLFIPEDEASFKVAYFRNSIKDYVTRFYNPAFPAADADFREYNMTFYNADRFDVSGWELQSRYDAGTFFADFAATYYFGARTCDAETAQKLRSVHNPVYSIDTAGTPNCVNGGFSGSYTNMQNPPKYAVNLTLGTRLLERRLTLGGRMTHTSKPTEKLDQAWNGNVTTLQMYYAPVTTFDLFATYKLRDNVLLQASINNVGDRYYLDPLAQSFMPAPGRTFRASMTVKF